MRRSAWSIVRVVFGLAGLAFLIVAFVRTVQRQGSDAFPSWPHLLAGAGLAIAAVALGSRGWLCLFSEEERPALRRGYYVSQLGKYIPGAIWQAVALVSSGVRSGAGRGRTSARFPVYMLTQAISGATVGAAVALTGAPTPARVLAPLGLLMLPLLSRRWMVWFFDRLRRWMKRSTSDDVIPSQESILRSYAWGILTMLVSAAAFAVVLSSFETPASPFASVVGFAAAWTAGFLALPFPSGVGIREAVLVGVLASAANGDVIAAAVSYRLLTMVAELVLVASVGVRRRGAALV